MGCWGWCMRGFAGQRVGGGEAQSVVLACGRRETAETRMRNRGREKRRTKARQREMARVAGVGGGGVVRRRWRALWAMGCWSGDRGQRELKRQGEGEQRLVRGQLRRGLR